MKSNMTLKIATCMVAVIGLSGCQGVLSKLGFSSSNSSRPASAQAIGEPDLVAGQESLRAGNIGQSIISFRLAMLDPASQADASNGLGIAYARLGRADLAERYFLAATEIAPLGKKYAANLMRFYESDLARTAQAKALRLQQAELARLENQSAVAANEATETARTARRGPILVRTRGDGESISSSADVAVNQTRPVRGVIQVVQRNAASAALGQPAPGRVATAGSTSQSAMVVGSRNPVQYPAKVDLDKAGEPAAVAGKEAEDRVAMAPRSKTIRPGYPIRFELDANSGTR